MTANSLKDIGTAPPDSREFRRVMGSLATGVAVVTTAWNGSLYGMTINSLTSVSLDPCLLLICPKRGSATGQAVRARGAFAVNLLAENQKAVSERFMGQFGERFHGLDVDQSKTGLPLLVGSIATICCTVAGVHPGGDHDIMLGEVFHCASDTDANPLVFYRGAFGAFGVPGNQVT